MHNRTAALLLVLPVSCVVAALVLPADPWHWFLLTMAIFGVSVACYFIGRRHGRTELDPTVDADAGRGRRRLQFSLGALLGLTTLVACLVAEITWQHRLDVQRDTRHQALQVYPVIAEALGNIGVADSGGGVHCDPGAGAVFEHGEWSFAKGTKLPSDFLDDATARISRRLGKVGAVVAKPERTGPMLPAAAITSGPAGKCNTTTATLREESLLREESFSGWCPAAARTPGECCSWIIR